MPRLLFILLLLLPLAGNAQTYRDFSFRTGDLLFQDLDCGDLCDAIEKVTQSAGGRHFSHLGLVCRKADSLYVIEAIGKDVHLTPLDRFINRQLDAQGRPKIAVGRLQPAYRRLNAAAVRFALQQLGTPYDDPYLYDNGKYYCSELIYDAYKAANGGRPFFRLSPMIFRDPGTGDTFPAWADYYRALQQPVPEGQPGCNPGGISTDPKIMMVHAFY